MWSVATHSVVLRITQAITNSKLIAITFVSNLKIIENCKKYHQLKLLERYNRLCRNIDLGHHFLHLTCLMSSLIPRILDSCHSVYCHNLSLKLANFTLELVYCLCPKSSLIPRILRMGKLCQVF